MRIEEINNKIQALSLHMFQLNRAMLDAIAYGEAAVGEALWDMMLEDVAALKTLVKEGRDVAPEDPRWDMYWREIVKFDGGFTDEEVADVFK